MPHAPSKNTPVVIVPVDSSSGRDGSVASRAVQAAIDTLGAFAADAECVRRIDRVGGMLAERFAAGNKVLICGNGGSACDAMHFAEELTGRFRAPPPGQPERRPLPAIACTDVGHITCTANDFGFEHIFSRWVEALGKPGDVLILLSTSGNSTNILNAAAAGRKGGLTTVALLGRDGGRLNGACDEQWVIRGEVADRIQEVHMMILHTLIECVEREMRV